MSLVLESKKWGKVNFFLKGNSLRSDDSECVEKSMDENSAVRFWKVK